MCEKKLVDHNCISAVFDDEEKAETLRVQGSSSSEGCVDGDGEAVTPRTAVYTPQVSSCTPGHDGDDPPSTPVPFPGAPSSRSPKKETTGLSRYARRVAMGFRRRFLDADSLPSMANELSVVEGRGSTPRSAGRTLTGTKDRARLNEDRFFAIEDVFALDTCPPSSYSQPLPVEGGAAGGEEGGGGAVEGAAQEGDKGVPIARVSAVVGKVGLYGAFDGHGGFSCANFVSENLPHGIKSSPAWARLAVRNHDDNITTASDHTEDNPEGEAAAHPENQPVARDAQAYGGGGGGGGGGGDLDDTLVGVMKEAILDGFRSTQEAFARQARPGNDSGSTAIVAVVCGRHVVIANLGDSGGLFHNDQDTLGGGSLTARTEFHTASNAAEKTRVEAAGGTFAANGRLFGKLHPTRSFGDQDIHRIKEGVLIAEPELSVHEVRPTANGVAFLVLGSDGLWDGVPDSKVIDVVRKENGQPRSRRKPGKVPLRIAQALTKSAAKRTIDDITAVVILFHKH